MAVGIRSSSTMRSSLRSISSRRRRISERLLSEVITSQHRRKRPRPEGGWGQASRGHLAERIGNVELNPPRSALLCRPYVVSNASLVAQDPVRDLFVSAKDLSLEAMAPTGPGTKTIEIDQSFEPRARNRRPTAGAALKMREV